MNAALRNAVRESFTELCNHPLRTALTLLGMIFGVAALVAMMSIGGGAQAEIAALIETMGARLTHVQAPEAEPAGLSEIINDSVGLSRADLRELRKAVPGISRAAYRVELPIEVTDLPIAQGEGHLLGVSDGLLELHGLRCAAGRGFVPADHAQGRRVAVLGNRLAAKLFGTKALGKQIRLGYSYFEVVGVLAARGSAKQGVPIDHSIYDASILIPYDTAIETVRPAPAYNEVDLISLESASTLQTLAVKARAMPVLTKLHGGREDFAIVAPEEILRQKQKTQSIFNAVLVAIAALSLIVGGIGVMNTMLASVLERVREIGLRRALGARQRHIRNQFLGEAVLLCVCGGLVGVLLGVAISLAAAWFMDLRPTFALASMALSVGVSSAVGLGFGIYPALRAARTLPVEALRGGVW